MGAARNEAVAAAVGAIRSAIADLTDRPVRLIAVTKTWPIESAYAAIGAGCDAIGENYAGEIITKFASDLGQDALGVPLVFVGQLQTNKVRQIVDLVDEVHSVDRISLVTELARRMPTAPVLIQVATAEADGKAGCSLAEVGALCRQATSAGLSVRGLMTVAPTGADDAEIRRGFRLVRAAATDLGLDECSMGMSDDYRIAVEEGSTQVRLGSALFGNRAPAVLRSRPALR